MNPNLPAALYARVSTRRQEQEATIESQLAQLLEYAQRNGHDVPIERQFLDQAISGQHLARPGLDRLRDAAAAGAFEVVLCLSPDRLARNLGAQQVVLDEMRQQGVRVIFLNQPHLEDTPQTQLLLNLQGAFAEYERTLISDRMRRGRLYRLRQGQSVPAQAPYGYRFQPASRWQASRWVVVAEEAAVVEQVFVWYTTENLSLGAVACRLNRQGLRSPEGKGWRSGNLGRLLRQPAYRGSARCNQHRTDASGIGQPRRQGRGTLRFPRYTPRPSEEWIEVPVPGLVSPALWQAAQERLEMNAQFARRNSRRPYLLRGLLVCGVCDHTLQGRTVKGCARYACQHGGAHCPPGVARHVCVVAGEVVEPLIWQTLADLLRDPQRLQTAWEALHTEQSTSHDEVSRWQQRQIALGKQRQRLLDAYQVSRLTLDELIERQNPLEVELRELQQRLAAVSHTAPVRLSLESFTHRIEQAMAAPNVETRQEVIRLLIERIVVTDGALTIEHIVPTVNDCRLHHVCREG